MHTPVKLRSVCISTASPSTSSVSSLLGVPMLRHKAPVFDIDSKNTSLELAAITVEITSGPSVCAMPISHIQGKASKEGNRDAPNAIAVVPVDGGPANDIARPAIRSSCILGIIPAAFLALACMTIPRGLSLGSNWLLSLSPRICE